LKTDALDDAIEVVEDVAEVVEDIEDALDEAAEKWRKCKRYMFCGAVVLVAIFVIVLILFGDEFKILPVTKYKISKGKCIDDNGVLGAVLDTHLIGKSETACRDICDKNEKCSQFEHGPESNTL